MPGYRIALPLVELEFAGKYRQLAALSPWCCLVSKQRALGLSNSS